MKMLILFRPDSFRPYEALLQQFVSSDVNQHQVIPNAILRYILSLFLKIEPNNIEMVRGIHGKPYIKHSQNPHDLQFNLSHSGEFAAIGLTLGVEVGVDVERIRKNIDILGISRSVFTNAECHKIRSELNFEDQHQKFVHLWSRKEAVIKYTGNGFYEALDTFSVLESYACGLQLTTIKPAPEYHATIASCTAAPPVIAYCANWRGILDLSHSFIVN